MPSTGVGGSDLLLARAKGEPVVVLAVVFQHSPFILMTRAGAGINTVTIWSASG